jgi:hypothetical protein
MPERGSRGVVQSAHQGQQARLLKLLQRGNAWRGPRPKPGGLEISSTISSLELKLELELELALALAPQVRYSQPARQAGQAQDKYPG